MSAMPDAVEHDSPWREVARRITASFQGGVRGLRTVGREAEYPLVHPDGSAGEAQLVIEALLTSVGGYTAMHRDGHLVGARNNDCEVAVEVGRGTLEISTRPCADLWEVGRVHRGEMLRVLDACSETGQLMLGFGIQPLASPSCALLTPKPHYSALTVTGGLAWDWFQVTAGDQLHVSIDPSEAVAALNTANRLAGVVVALCGNSSVYRGNGVRACEREARVLELALDESRHGPLGDVMCMEELVSSIASRVMLVDGVDADYAPIGEPFVNWIDRQSSRSTKLYGAYLFHDHYSWNAARLRPATGTIELRAACQQPHDESDAAGALYLGLVDGWRELLNQELPQGLSSRDFYKLAAHNGLDVPASVTGFIKQVLHTAERALRRRGMGEEILMGPLWRRLEDRMNPGQRARQKRETEGFEAFLDSITITSVG